MPGSLRQCADVELSRRLQAAWGKFHERRSILTDRQISIRRRLKLLDSVVTPTVLFGLPTLALATRQKEQLGVLQRRMLRLIAGRVRLDDDDWNVTMRRMSDRVDRALSLYPVRSWRERLEAGARPQPIPRTSSMSLGRSLAKALACNVW